MFEYYISKNTKKYASLKKKHKGHGSFQRTIILLPEMFKTNVQKISIFSFLQFEGVFLLDDRKFKDSFA